MKTDTEKRIKLFITMHRRIFIVIFHILLIVFSYLSAFYLRFDFFITDATYDLFLKTLLWVLLVKLCVFYYFRIFQGLWRYVSMSDLWQILRANAAASLLAMAGILFFYGAKEYPRSIFIIDYIICFSLLAGVRFFTRLYRERYKRSIIFERQKVLIIGAGEAGILTFKEYKNNPELGEVVGFIDDDRVKYNETIQGVKILGDRHAIQKVIKTHQVNEIILAIPSAKGQVIRDLIVCCQSPGVKLKIVPGLSKILSGDLRVALREVQPEDLLGRETVNIDKCEIAKYLKNKSVLITGAAGSIGSELCRQVAGFGPEELLLIDHNENNLYFLLIELRNKFKSLRIKSVIGDINDVGVLKQLFSEHRPQVVFHAAAYKHVPLMEENPLAAVKNNSLGSRNLIYASHHYKVERFVLISTDKAVNPINIMGLSKRLAEVFLQAKAKRSKTKFMAVRFGNVLGSDGSVVPLFKKQIESGGPITVTHPEATRYFMSIKEAVLLVLQAGALGTGGELFILDMGEQIKIVDLVRDLVALSGLELNEDIHMEFIGLRPGEKVHEELLLDKEKDKTTKHDKIFINQADDFDLIALRKDLKELERYVNINDKEKVVKKIKKMMVELSHGMTE